MLKALALAAPLAVGALGTAAQAMTYATAGELRDDCAAIPRMLQGDRAALAPAGECIAFIDGAVGLAQAIAADRKPAIFCIPDRITNVDIAAAFVQAVDRTPVLRTHSAGGTVYQMLVDSFPCKAL